MIIISDSVPGAKKPAKAGSKASPKGKKAAGKGKNPPPPIKDVKPPVSKPRDCSVDVPEAGNKNLKSHS